MKTLWLTKPLMGGALLVVAWFAVAPPCRAENVQVTIVAVLANDRDGKVDEKIKCIADEARKRDPSLTGFRLARSSCKSLPVGSKETFALVDDEVAVVTIKHGADKDDMVEMTVKAPRVGEIVYSVKCGKCFAILSRYQTKDNDRLIIGIMVKPCNKGKPAGKEKK